MLPRLSPVQTGLTGGLLGSQECWKSVFPEGKLVAGRGAHGDWLRRRELAGPELGRDTPSLSLPAGGVPEPGRRGTSWPPGSGRAARDVSLSAPEEPAAPLQRQGSGHSQALARLPGNGQVDKQSRLSAWDLRPARPQASSAARQPRLGKLRPGLCGPSVVSGDSPFSCLTLSQTLRLPLR